MKKRILALAVCMLMLIGIPQAGASVTLRGDADCDGKVTAADASLILRYTVGLSDLSVQGRENADANIDECVDSSDAAVILRHLVKLVDIVDLTPMPSITPTPKPTPTPSPTPTPALDQTLLEYVRIGTAKGSNTYHDWTEYAEDITLFIQSMPESNPYRAILYQGATHMGEAYVSGQMDCSGFVRTTYRECGYSKYPSGGSKNVIAFFKDKKRLNDVSKTDSYIDTSNWESGYILAYVDSDGVGNHVSIYLGCVDGVEFVMESSSSRNGVCIRRLWTDTTWQLKYYINPLPWPS